MHKTIYLQPAACISNIEVIELRRPIGTEITAVGLYIYHRKDHGNAVLLDTLYFVSAGLKGKSRLLLLDF